MTQEEQIKQVAEYDGVEIKIIDAVNYPAPNHQWQVKVKGKVVSQFYGSEEDFYKKLQLYNDLNGINPVWVKVYAEVIAMRLASEAVDGSYKAFQLFNEWRHIPDAYHTAINYGNISAALTAVSDAITWLKEQKK